MSSQNPDLYGVSRIRSGIGLYLIAVGVGIISTVLVALLVLTVGLRAYPRPFVERYPFAPHPFGPAFAGGLIAAGIAVVIVVAVLGFIALLRVREGFDALVKIGRDVSLGKTGTTLIFVAIAIGVIGAVFLFPSVFAGGSLLLLAGVLFGVGGVFLAIAFRQLGKLYNNSTAETAGTLSLVGAILAFVPVLGVVGYILVLVGLILLYNSLRAVEKSLSAGASPPGAYAVTYQQQNVIRSNGIAYVTVLSQSQADVTRAEILGTQYNTNNVVPSKLVQGLNSLTINFNTTIALTPGTIYTIRLYLSNGATIDVNAVFTQ